MIRRALGRGLDALIENTEVQIGPACGRADGDGAQLQMVAVDRIVPGPFQPRQHFDAARLQELTRAIESQGIIEPLVVRPAISADEDELRYELIAGERRLRAARDAGLGSVPVIIRELDDAGALEMSLVENLAREDLNAIEEGRAFVRLAKEFALSHDEIAARIGKSRPYVSNTIRLLDLPLAVVDMIAHGELSAGQARPLLALASAEAQVLAARRIAEGKISARGAEAIASVHRRRRRNGAGIHSNDDANLAALVEGIQRALRRKVRVVNPRGKRPGRIEIDYYNDNDLTALAAMLTGQSRPAAHF